MRDLHFIAPNTMHLTRMLYTRTQYAIQQTTTDQDQRGLRSSAGQLRVGEVEPFPQLCAHRHGHGHDKFLAWRHHVADEEGAGPEGRR